MSSVTKRVQSNLLQQNVFVRDVNDNALSSVSSQDSYLSLDEKTTKNGTVQELNSYPYPITPQYVNSFVDSVDYRKDPMTAVANGSKGNNLGDIREIQRITGLDASKAQELYSRLKSEFAKASKPVSADSGDSVKEGDSNE